MSGYLSWRPRCGKLLVGIIFLPEVDVLPFYDLKCKCGEVFNAMASVSDRENRRIRCPKCGSNDLEAVFTNVNIIRSGKSAGTECPNLGQCGGSCPHLQ